MSQKRMFLFLRDFSLPAVYNGFFSQPAQKIFFKSGGSEFFKKSGEKL